MPDPAYLAAATAAAAVTFTLRALPFALLSRLRSAPTTGHLARHLPAGIMIILVVYLLRDTPLTRPPYGLIQLLPGRRDRRHAPVAPAEARQHRRRHHRPPPG